MLHEISGLSHAAVGEALGTDAADARHLLHEARVSLAAFGLGRDLDCHEVRGTIADGDRRALRARTLKAHLRGCEGCAAFAAAQDERRRRLAAFFPVLPAIAAARILEEVLGDRVAARATAGALGAGGVGRRLGRQRIGRRRRGRRRRRGWRRRARRARPRASARSRSAGSSRPARWPPAWSPPSPSP